MPVDLHHPRNAPIDRYQLIVHEEDSRFDELFLLLSHAQSLEQELQQALGTKRWTELETQLLSNANLVQGLDFLHRKTVFVDTTITLEESRDSKTNTVLEQKYWVHRLLILTYLCATLLVALTAVAVVGTEEMSNAVRSLLVPGSLAVFTASTLIQVQNRQYNRSADKLAVELTNKIATLHREALEGHQDTDFPVRD